MLGPIQTEEFRATMNALLATNGRSFDDQARNDLLRSLSEHQLPADQQRRAPKVTPAFLRDLEAAARRKQEGG